MNQTKKWFAGLLSLAMLSQEAGSYPLVVPAPVSSVSQNSTFTTQALGPAIIDTIYFLFNKSQAKSWAFAYAGGQTQPAHSPTRQTKPEKIKGVALYDNERMNGKASDEGTAAVAVEEEDPFVNDSPTAFLEEVRSAIKQAQYRYRGSHSGLKSAYNMARRTAVLQDPFTKDIESHFTTFWNTTGTLLDRYAEQSADDPRQALIDLRRGLVQLDQAVKLIFQKPSLTSLSATASMYGVKIIFIEFIFGVRNAEETHLPEAVKLLEPKEHPQTVVPAEVAPEPIAVANEVVAAPVPTLQEFREAVATARGIATAQIHRYRIARMNAFSSGKQKNLFDAAIAAQRSYWNEIGIWMNESLLSRTDTPNETVRQFLIAMERARSLLNEAGMGEDSNSYFQDANAHSIAAVYNVFEATVRRAAQPYTGREDKSALASSETPSQETAQVNGPTELKPTPPAPPLLPAIRVFREKMEKERNRFYASMALALDSRSGIIIQNDSELGAPILAFYATMFQAVADYLIVQRNQEAYIAAFREARNTRNRAFLTMFDEAAKGGTLQSLAKTISNLDEEWLFEGYTNFHTMVDTYLEGAQADDVVELRDAAQSSILSAAAQAQIVVREAAAKAKIAASATPATAPAIVQPSATPVVQAPSPAIAPVLSVADRREFVTLLEEGSAVFRAAVIQAITTRGIRLEAPQMGKINPLIDALIERLIADGIAHAENPETVTTEMLNQRRLAAVKTFVDTFGAYIWQRDITTNSNQHTMILRDIATARTTFIAGPYTTALDALVAKAAANRAPAAVGTENITHEFITWVLKLLYSNRRFGSVTAHGPGHITIDETHGRIDGSTMQRAVGIAYAFYEGQLFEEGLLNGTHFNMLDPEQAADAEELTPLNWRQIFAIGQDGAEDFLGHGGRGPENNRGRFAHVSYPLVVWLLGIIERSPSSDLGRRDREVLARYLRHEAEHAYHKFTEDNSQWEDLAESRAIQTGIQQLVLDQFILHRYQARSALLSVFSWSPLIATGGLLGNRLRAILSPLAVKMARGAVLMFAVRPRLSDFLPHPAQISHSNPVRDSRA